MLEPALLCMITIVFKNIRRKKYVYISSTEFTGKRDCFSFNICIDLWWILVLFIRPQKKEQKRVQAMIAEMEVGDTVLTSSGFYGVIIDISDDDLIVEFGNNKNCRIPMQKAAIAQVEKASAE